jgi:hypothetical protein
LNRAPLFAPEPLNFPCGLTRLAGTRVLSRAYWVIVGAAIDRRDFCGLSAAAAVLALSSFGDLAAAGAVVAIPTGLPIYKAIFDDRFSAAREFGSTAERNGMRTARIRGDVTALWFDDLKAHWESGGAAIAGMTTPRTLLCLEQLAHDTWRRVLMRVEYPTSPAVSEPQLVSWIIGV